MECGTDALSVDVHIHDVVIALVIVVAEDGSRLDIHIMTDDAVAHEVEMGDGTSFLQHRGLHLTTDAHLRTGSHKDAATQIRVGPHKTVSRDNSRGLDGHVMTDHGRPVDSHAVLDMVFLAERLHDTGYGLA